MRKLGIYVHVPYCKKKCIYCDFYSVTDISTQEEYFSSIIKQIKKVKNRSNIKSILVDSIYFGGGTPSYVKPKYILDIISAIKQTFTVSKNCEITLEMNPGTVTGSSLSQYKAAGINRLSIGLQSANDDELEMLSRIHTKDKFEETFALCRIEGFDNINIDLMYALPNQSEEKLVKSIKYVTSLNPEHISLYGLKVEPETPLASNTKLVSQIPDEDTQYSMFVKARDILEKNGYEQYEISNFAKPGKECIHNLKYWHSEEYLGFGASASSFFNNELYTYVKDINTIISTPLDIVQTICSTEDLSSIKEQAKQYLMLAFRLSEGINIETYKKRFGLDFEEEYLPKIKKYLDNDFIEKTQIGYRLSKSGMLVSNYILSDILDFTKKE